MLQGAVLAFPVVVLTWAAWDHRSMFADGFIYLHIVQNILAGHGPVFNSGQRVEVFTSPLWTFVLSVFGFLTPFPLDWLAVVVGIMMTVTGASLALMGSHRLVRRVAPHAFLLPLGIIVFVVVAPVWSLASTGMETGLTFMWLGLCFLLLAQWAERPAHHLARWSLVVLGMGWLIRPELAVDSVVFVAIVLWVDRGLQTRERRFRIVAWAAALPVMYEIFRMGYYGVLVANTATAKEATMPRVGRGIEYFADFVGPYWLFVPAVALLLGAYYPHIKKLRRSAETDRAAWAFLALPIAGALNASYVVVMGGDYVHARLLAPAFFAACAPVSVVPVTKRYLVALIVLPWALVCALSLRTTDSNAWSNSPFYYVNGHGNVAPSKSNWGPHGLDIRWYTGSGTYVELGESPTQTVHMDVPDIRGVDSPVIVTAWIGPESYVLGTNVHYLDFLGLADPFTAHLALVKRGELAGHEKVLPTPWIAALLGADGSSINQLASLQKELPNDFTPLIPEVSGRSLDIQTAWATATLSCPTVHDLEYSPSEPLTVGGFFSNIYHSFDRNQLRIPPDPETAYHRFCGAGTPPQVEELSNDN